MTTARKGWASDWRDMRPFDSVSQIEEDPRVVSENQSTDVRFSTEYESTWRSESGISAGRLARFDGKSIREMLETLKAQNDNHDFISGALKGWKLEDRKQKQAAR